MRLLKIVAAFLPILLVSPAMAQVTLAVTETDLAALTSAFTGLEAIAISVGMAILVVFIIMKKLNIGKKIANQN